mmetsp:Transcript_17390/g.32760  ORF Transcript_17390/g.32760 Transcript_17390/m.32760 type:complete len:229 (+) Transcript_17390:469-1155(+)
MSQRCDQLVVRQIAPCQLPELNQCLQAVQMLPLTSAELIHHDVRRRVQLARRHEGLDQLARFLQWFLLEELFALRIVIDLLGLSTSSHHLLRFLLLSLFTFALLLVLQPALLLRAQFCLFVSVLLCFARGALATEFQVVELQVYLDCVLGGPTIELVREEAILHPQHCHIRLQCCLPQTIIMEIELVLRNIIEMLEGLIELLQSLAIVFLSRVAPANCRFVPHALHIV